MRLEDLLRLNRVIRVVGFDDAPFVRGVGNRVNIAGVVCAGTQFEGMVWGEGRVGVGMLRMLFVGC